MAFDPTTVTPPTVNPTPDATAAPDIQDTSTPPLMPTQTNPQSLPPSSQPQPSQSAAPASAPASSSDVPGGILGGIVSGALEGAKNALVNKSAAPAPKGGGVLSTIGRGFKNLAENSPYGIAIKDAHLEQQAKQQKIDFAKNEEQRAQQKAIDEHAKAMSQEETERLNHNTLSMAQAKAQFDNHLEQEQKTAEVTDSNDKFFTQLGAMGVDPQWVEHHYDDITKDHLKGIVDSSLTPLGGKETGNDAGLHIYNTSDLKGVPSEFDIKIDTNWHVDPKTGELKPEGTAILPAGTDLYTAWMTHTAQIQKGQTELMNFEQSQKAQKDLADTIKAKNEAGGMLNKIEQDPAEMAGDKAPAVIAMATSHVNDPATAPADKARWQTVLARATNEQKIVEDAKARIAATKLAADNAGGTHVDNFGNVSPLGSKEFDRRYDKFNASKQYQNLATLQGSYDQFQDVTNQIKSGRGLTGPDSVVALFNAIGISGTPLAGKGFRINQNTIQEHVDARGLDQAAYQKLLALKSGDVITPQQILDYANIATHTYQESFINAANEEKRELGFVDVLPLGNNRPVDPTTDAIYMRIAGGDRTAANKALAANGWQVAPAPKAPAPLKPGFSRLVDSKGNSYDLPNANVAAAIQTHPELKKVQ